MKRKLYEYAGVFDGCEELAIEIANRIYSEWCENGEVKPYESLSPIAIPCDFADFGTLYIKPTKLNVRGAYILERERLGYTLIIVNPLVIDFKNEGPFISTLMHELTHMYRDTMKRIHGTSELDSARKDGYFNAYDYKFGEHSPNDLKKSLADFLYITNQMEAPAYFAGLYGYLANSSYEIEDANDALEVIHSSRHYKAFMKTFNSVKEWVNITDANTQKQLVLYLNELSTVNVRTFGQFKRYVMGRYNRCSRKLMQLIPKMVSKFFEEN